MALTKKKISQLRKTNVINEKFVCVTIKYEQHAYIYTSSQLNPNLSQIKEIISNRN